MSWWEGVSGVPGLGKSVKNCIQSSNDVSYAWDKTADKMYNKKMTFSQKLTLNMRRKLFNNYNHASSTYLNVSVVQENKEKEAQGKNLNKICEQKKKQNIKRSFSLYGRGECKFKCFHKSSLEMKKIQATQTETIISSNVENTGDMKRGIDHIYEIVKPVENTFHEDFKMYKIKRNNSAISSRTGTKEMRNGFYRNVDAKKNVRFALNEINLQRSKSSCCVSSSHPQRVSRNSDSLYKIEFVDLN